MRVTARAAINPEFHTPGRGGRTRPLPDRTRAGARGTETDRTGTARAGAPEPCRASLGPPRPRDVSTVVRGPVRGRGRGRGCQWATRREWVCGVEKTSRVRLRVQSRSGQSEHWTARAPQNVGGYSGALARYELCTVHTRQRLVALAAASSTPLTRRARSSQRLFAINTPHMVGLAMAPAPSPAQYVRLPEQ